MMSLIFSHGPNTKNCYLLNMYYISLITIVSLTGMIRSYLGFLLVHIGSVKIPCQSKIRHFSYQSLSKENISGSQISMYPLKYKIYLKTRYVKAPGGKMLKSESFLGVGNFVPVLFG